MRFKVDQNLPPEVSGVLRQHGHNVLTFWDEGLRGNPDSVVAEAIRRERRTLITFDVGFANIRSYPREDFAGLIVLRLEKQSRKHEQAVFQRAFELFAREPLEGYL